MDSTILNLGEDLSGFLATLGQPIEQTAREMIVFELYRRSLVSSGKAAELLSGRARVARRRNEGHTSGIWLTPLLHRIKSLDSSEGATTFS